MRTSVRWTETAAAVNGVRPPINSIAYSPSGDYVIASCGVRVLVYAASTGSLMKSLKGHEDTVYCVDYSSDGKRFFSGGADKAVFVWTTEGVGSHKFLHKDSVQAIAANPATTQVATISSVDWGIWSPETTKVPKRALPSKGLCAAWTLDGQTLAIGTLDGTILLAPQGEEAKQHIKRDSPVWALAFNPLRENGVDILTVGSWDQRLSFYNLSGAPVGKEKEIDCDPCSISFYDDGEYILVSGSNHNVAMYTKDGNKLVNVAEADDWVWSAKQRPRHKQICCGTNDGTISNIEINTTTVHCIYQDQYVCREKMTDVMVHRFALDRKMRIPCNDYVRKLATYRGRVAVQFQERIVIFEIFQDDERNMRYQDIAQIRRRIECSIMCVTANAVVLCKERRLTLYDFQGNKRREWVMDSTIRYLKVSGGVEGRELLLVGLKNGQAVKVFVDNPFPTPLVTVSSAVHCLDLSSSRTKLAVVDENNLLQVFDLEKKNEVIFSEANATAVAWNTEFEDMIAYSTGGNTLNIKTSNLPAYQQPMRGVVVGFKANRVLNLRYDNMIVVDVPHAHALYRYIEDGDYEAAYRVATRGVTASDWKMLGMHAMTNLQLDIARRAFTHIHEVKFVELLNGLELQRRQKTKTTPAAAAGGATSSPADAQNTEEDTLLLADILAFQGKYQEAARQFLKCGHENRAIDMYCDLKMWDEARKICSDQNHLKELIRQQARWAEDSQNYVEAASLYENCGDYDKAVRMLGQSGQIDKLMQMCRSLPKTKAELITRCATYFRQQNAIPYALEAYEKVGDNRALIQIYVGMSDWRRAFAVLDKHPQFVREVYVPWAGWLADNDKFEEAVEAFRAAKWPQEAVRMMETLAANSVTCRKFRDAAFYYVHLAGEYGQFGEDEKFTESQLAYRIKLSNDCMRKADMYFAYSAIYTHTTQPLPYNELKLYRMARYLLAMCSEDVIPVNIGKAEILFTLARAANRLDMVRTARTVFEKLQTVILPLPIMEQVDVETLLVRGKSFTDREDLLDTCYRCSQVVAQLTDPGDRCPHCSHPFVRSFVRFEVLPLVEFTLSNDLSDEEAERLIRSGLGRQGGVSQRQGAVEAHANNGKPKEWQAENGANVISFENDNIDHMMDQQLIAMGRTKAAVNRTGDPFVSQLQFITRPGRDKGVYMPFVATIDMIKSFHRDEVFVVKPPYGSLPAPNRYYRLMKKDARITQCEGCQHFFSAEEYEFECMKGAGCPLCRFKPGRQVGRSLREVMLEMETDRPGQ